MLLYLRADIPRDQRCAYLHEQRAIVLCNPFNGGLSVGLPGLVESFEEGLVEAASGAERPAGRIGGNPRLELRIMVARHARLKPPIALAASCKNRRNGLALGLRLPPKPFLRCA